MPYLKYFSVIATSMLKFLGGPLAGLALGLPWIETAICCVIGMMTTLFLVLFLSEVFTKIRVKYFPPKSKPKKFTKTMRWAVAIKQRFGLWGIALLTPILFSPAGGAFLSVAFGYNRKQIIIKMLLSAIFWAAVQTPIFYQLTKIKALF